MPVQFVYACREQQREAGVESKTRLRSASTKHRYWWSYSTPNSSRSSNSAVIVGVQWTWSR